MGQDLGHGLPGSPVFAVFREAAIKGPQFPSEGLAGKGLRGSFTWPMAEFSYSHEVTLRASAPCRLLARGHPQFLVTGTPAIGQLTLSKPAKGRVR